MGPLVLDVLLEEEHYLNSSITDHPIEEGGVIQDHISNEPRRLIIRGFITDTPLLASDVPLGTIRTTSSYQILEQLWLSRQPFAVLSQYRFFDNMVIESLHIPKNTRESALRFNAYLKEITFVSSQNATIPASSGSPLPGGQSKTGGGIADLNANNVVRNQIDATALDLGRPSARPLTATLAPEVIPDRNRSWVKMITGSITGYDE
jgi:hypothetical protein